MLLHLDVAGGGLLFVLWCGRLWDILPNHVMEGGQSSFVSEVVK